MKDYNKNSNPYDLTNRLRLNSYPPNPHQCEPNINKSTDPHHLNVPKIRLPSISSSSTQISNMSPMTVPSDSNKSSPSLRDILKNNIVIERVPDENEEQQWHYTSNKKKTKVYGMEQYNAKRSKNREAKLSLSLMFTYCP